MSESASEIIPDKPDPQYWRERAKTTRANAERITNLRAKRMMLGAAAGYERLAERIERHKFKTWGSGSSGKAEENP
jgi:hypothetical protein